MTNKFKSSDLESPIIYLPKEVGKSMQEVEVNIIETTNQSVISRWFHSELNADLFIWTDNKNNIIKQQVINCGQVVEWNIVEGVKTGYIVEDEAVQEKESQQKIFFDEKSVKYSIVQAVEIIDNIDKLGLEIKSVLNSNLKNDTKIGNMSPLEVVSKFGLKSDSWIKNLLSGAVVRILQRFHKKQK